MELSLDLSLTYVPKTISELLSDVSRSTDGAERLSSLEDFLKRLEEEMRKIEAFKRELPLCMNLMNDVILRLREQKVQYMETEDQPTVVEKFNPLKKSDGEDGTADNSNDKKSWMSSAQLWSTDTISTIEDHDRSVPENPIHSWNKKNRAGAFVPLNGVNSEISFSKTSVRDTKVPSLSLMTPLSELSTSHSKNNSRVTSGTSMLPEPISKTHDQRQGQLQASRKQRRCWSPELHRRFVDALQQLGGPQVATPKQIRELMHADGLTNDEVKSHLQKYRLHVRRVPSSSAPHANGLHIMSQEAQDQSAETSKTKSLSQSGSPQGPLVSGASMRGLSSTGGNSFNAEEDENSEGYSWKGGLHQQGEADVQS